MAEKVVSPGVFTNEIDQSFLPAAIGEIGGAIIGPTVKGPALVPTVVTSYSEFQQTFGDTFQSGSDYYQYLTSHTAREYLRQAPRLTVVRILDDAFTEATASIENTKTVGSATATAAFSFKHNPTGSIGINQATGGPDEFRIGSVSFVFVSSSAGLENSTTQRFVNFGTGNNLHATSSAVANLVTAINASTIAGVTNLTASRGGVTTNINGALILSGSSSGTDGNLTITTGSGTDDTATTANFVQSVNANLTTQNTTFALTGGTNTNTTNLSFRLKTHSHGTILNNINSTTGASKTHLTGSNLILLSGSEHNVRWEVTSRNANKGTFTLLVRRGDDSNKRKQILETWNNLSLDPKANNYIERVIGNSRINQVGSGTDVYLQESGSYPNNSKYVYVSDVSQTPRYLDENGNIRLDSQTGSLPTNGSGSYHGGFTGGSDGYVGFDAFGNQQGGDDLKVQLYSDIDSSDSQGYILSTINKGKTAYETAINLLANQDEYDINLLMLPGVISGETNHSAIAQKAIDMVEDRGDCFLLLDPVKYGSAVTTATAEAETRDSNYAAVYWPWVQIADPQLGGTRRFVPPSVVIPSVYGFNDKVAHEWFAPAGLNRGGLDSVVQAERKLTQANRDTLYESNVNPIATFPGQGVTVFGQKTLQKKSSALDRINVRRLLIRLKKFIASSSRFLVFEQNTNATRARFLAIVNPFLENVQSNSGLNAFRVVMDETNNTPDVVDRNILYGQIFVQPTKTAEFIVLDFTVQPTGATFPE